MGVDWPREFPGVHWFDEEEDRAVLEVLHQGAPFRYYGQNKPQFVDFFESGARDSYGVKHAHALNSGTGALITAMQALDVGPGCEVIVPSFMWVATVAAVVQNNAVPVLCEVDDSFTMDVEDLKRKITPRTKLIVPVHMLGGVCQMEAIVAVAREHEIAVLEDCAQANGGTFHGRHVGTFGNLGMYSLQINKNITAGEGGLLVTDDDRLAARIASIHDLGVSWIDGGPAQPEDDALGWGQGRRMSELCGAVASVQMKKLPRIVEHMRASHGRIRAMLSDVPGIAFRRFHDDDGHTGSFLVMIAPSEKHARKAVERTRQHALPGVCRLADYGLHVYHNIASLVRKVPLSPAGNPWNLPENAASDYNYEEGACPNSDALFARSILLPIPSRLTPRQEREGANAIRDAVSPECRRNPGSE